MSKKTFRIGILASTNGTILPKIFEADLPNTEFSVFITNKSKCGAREKAKEKGIPTFFIAGKNKTREEWDAKAIEILKKHQVNLVILVGYMRIVTPLFVNAFPGKILNVHPSLLPKFAGGMDTDVHAEVIAAEEKETGATIHIVTEEVDSGPIVLQKSVQIEENETPESLKNKVQKIEGKIYPEAILKMIKKLL